MSKRITSLLIALILLIGTITVPASADGQASVQLESKYLTVGVDEISIISARISDGSDCKVNFISTSDLVTIGETVYNESTHVSSATVKGKATGKDMILAIADGSYRNDVCIATVSSAVEDGKVVNHTLKSGTASSNDNTSPAAEQPAKAFDNSVDTKWLVFNNTAWLQYRFDNEQRFVVNAYIVASANDDDIRDPVDWQLLGSNDGATWDVLDTRSGEKFEARKMKRTFYIDNTQAYEFYRFNITKNNGDYRIQISELQLLEYGNLDASADISTLPDNQVTDLTLNAGLASASAESVGVNNPENAFDKAADTKWMIPAASGWLQYQFKNGEYAANAYAIASSDSEPKNLSLGATATASSSDSPANIKNAIDGNHKTRWTSTYNDNQWYRIDFGKEVTFNTVVIEWEAAHSKDYTLEYSNDGSNYTNILSEPNCQGGKEIKSFDSVTARYLRISMGGRATKWGHSFWEFEVYNAGPDDSGLIRDNSAADPKAWELLGSNDGTNWVTLDSRSNEKFDSRMQKKYYLIDNNESYAYYRLNVTENNGDSRLQLSELQLINYLADKTELNAVIEKAKNVDSAALSGASSKMLSDMIDYAQAVSDKVNMSQLNVDKAAAQLQKALNSITFTLAYSAAADKDVYTVNESISISVTTSTDVKGISLYNESGKYVHVVSSDYVDDGDMRNWTVTTAVGSTGNRTLGIFAKNMSGEIKDTGLSVSFKIVKTAPVAPSLNEAELLATLPVKVNQMFNIKVVTSTAVGKVCIANENGSFLGNTASYTDNGSVRTWDISLCVGTAGNREFTIKAKSGNVMLEDCLNISITVVK